MKILPTVVDKIYLSITAVAIFVLTIVLGMFLQNLGIIGLGLIFYLLLGLYIHDKNKFELGEFISTLISIPVMAYYLFLKSIPSVLSFVILAIPVLIFLLLLKKLI